MLLQSTVSPLCRVVLAAALGGITLIPVTSSVGRDRSHTPRGVRVGECVQDPTAIGIANQVVEDSMARGRPGLRIATPSFNKAWRIVSGLTWSSLPIEAHERPDAYRETARST